MIKEIAPKETRNKEQLNTDHCKGAMAHLSLYTRENKVYILFTQEPCCYDGAPCYIPPGYLYLHVPSDTNTRASLLIRREIAHNFLLLQHRSNSDNVIVVTSTYPQLYIASSYLPTYDTLEQDLTPIGSFLTAVKPTNFIWGLDANSKHSTWFSTITDNRGKTLVDFLLLHGLITANEKDSPTYCGPNGESWIDMRVTTIKSAQKVQSWRVSEECTLSDHSLILFALTIEKNKNLNRTAGDYTRNCATQIGNWNLFQTMAEKCGIKWRDWINSAIIKEKLDNSITELWSNLGEAGKECFPPFLPKSKYAPWWSPNLNALRKQVNTLKRRVKRSKNQTLKVIYTASFKALKIKTNQNFSKPSKNPGETSVLRTQK